MVHNVRWCDDIVGVLQLQDTLNQRFVMLHPSESKKY